jgi:hypothetical protein
MKRWAVVITLFAVVIFGAYWFTREPEPRKIPTSPPAAAPAVGSCWQVDLAAAQRAMPWAGAPVDCAGQHTAEVYYVGQVGSDLLRQHDTAKGEELKIIDNLLYAQARRACVIQAPIYLSGAWHNARLQVLASWIEPATDGFYGCALAEVEGPAAQRLMSRQGGLKDALKSDDSPLGIECVSRGAGDALTYVTCDQAHDGEFVGSYTITPLDAPFDDAGVRNAAQRGCAELALKYLGITGAGSRTDLNAGSVGPKTASDWLGSDQTFGCYAMAVQGKLKGSIRGLGERPLPR